jgi:uncharacterized protein (UPF0333 family)
MFKYFNNKRKKGQSTLEYAILIVIIIGALLSIQVYIKRGIQGRMRSATDDIGDQFSPGNTNYIETTRTVSGSHDTFEDGLSVSTLTRDEQTNTLMNQQMVNTEFSYWGGR